MHSFLLVLIVILALLGLAAALGEVSDSLAALPIALQLRNLQGMVEIGVDKNTTVVFPAPLMSTIAEPVLIGAPSS